jgi:hypothetical protein
MAISQSDSEKRKLLAHLSVREKGVAATRNEMISETDALPLGPSTLKLQTLNRVFDRWQWLTDIMGLASSGWQ